MKNLLSLMAVCLIILFSLNNVKAQSYQTAAGLKFGGYENGLSLKYFLHNEVALEGILGFRNNGVVITGLYEKHQNLFDVNGLKVYYGFGAHIGSVGAGGYQKIGGNTQIYNSSQVLLGADAVLGSEYVIPNAPIALSLDLNPRLELAGGSFFDIAPGLGVKYLFR